jgi:hypothetical protein
MMQTVQDRVMERLAALEAQYEASASLVLYTDGTGEVQLKRLLSPESVRLSEDFESLDEADVAIERLHQRAIQAL